MMKLYYVKTLEQLTEYLISSFNDIILNFVLVRQNS